METSIYQTSAFEAIRKHGYDKARQDAIRWRDMNSPGTVSYAFHNAVLKCIEAAKTKDGICTFRTVA